MGSAIGGGFVPWNTLAAQAPTDLDPPIRPLVEALNRTAWTRTVFSCGGHPEEPDSVAKGRRQAHVDLLVGDAARWRRVSAAVRRLGRRHLRVTEGSIGPVPDWLRPHLSQAKWEYRRLVFEPVPYEMPAEACREVLDAALAAAVSALEESAL